MARNGDAANKIGTYLKALAAHDNHVPFAVALPSSTFDFTLAHGDGIFAFGPTLEATAQILFDQLKV